MKKLVAMFALFLACSLPVAAEDGLNPTSEQLDQALEQVKSMGYDTSNLPDREKLKQMLSGESGKRFQEMAKKFQEQNPEQFRQIQQNIQQRFDKNGDGTLGPRERELAQQAFQQRQSNRSGQASGNRPQLGDQARDHFDRNDDGQLGPREREAARDAMQQRRSNSGTGQTGDHPSTSDRVLNRFDRNDDGQLGQRERKAANEARQQHQHQHQQGTDRGPRPDGAGANRMSRPGGEQGQQRANNDSRPPQSRPAENAGGRSGNQFASGRDARPSGGANRGGPSGGANHGGGGNGGGGRRGGR